MLRRRITFTTAAAVTGAAPLVQRRCVTTRGQFNPIHDFSVSFGKYGDGGDGGAKEEGSGKGKGGPAPPLTSFAKDEAEFERIITNPGPMRVGYSTDYLNWLYLAYKNKVDYERQRQKAEQQSQGDDIGAPAGKFLRPPSSFRRRAGEAKKAVNQALISSLARRQGLYDLMERQSQFPFVDLANATRFHYVALFKDIVLDYFDANYFNLSNAAGGGDGDATSANGCEGFSFAQEVWDRALLYRALLEERRNTYPERTFAMVFDAVRETNLVPLSAAAAADPSKAAPSPLCDRCPTEEQYIYFRYLVRKYFVENAVEGHVVLKAHRQPNAAELLFSAPPPKDDSEVFASLLPKERDGRQPEGKEADGGGKEEAGLSVEALKRIVRVKPGRYPPIEALWRCEENLPLLKILVFGELNLFASENPFVKFPNALSFLTRPYANVATDGSVGGGPESSRGGGGGYRQHRGDVLSLASIIAERRGSRLVGFPRSFASLIDGRHTDIHRQQQRFHREDILAFSKVLRQSSSITGRGAGVGGRRASSTSSSAAASDEDNAFFYGAFSDYGHYNPRTIRAEKRDYLSRKMVAALKEVRAAEEDIFRSVGIEEAESQQQYGRTVEGLNTLPVHLPTLPHYAAIIRKDPHVSYLLCSGLSEPSSDGERPGAGGGKRGELERLVLQLARALSHTAMHYHKQTVRRVNKQKANIAAALLDSFVEEEVARAKQAIALSAAPSFVDGAVDDDRMRLVNSLGVYRRFENRALDESGYFTDARMDDYKRWMAAPQS